jgi:hypothetical protein
LEQDNQSLAVPTQTINIKKDGKVSTTWGTLYAFIIGSALIVIFYFTNVKGEIEAKADKSATDSSLTKLFKRDQIQEDAQQDILYLLLKYIKQNNPSEDLEYFERKYNIKLPLRTGGNSEKENLK